MQRAIVASVCLVAILSVPSFGRADVKRYGGAECVTSYSTTSQAYYWANQLQNNSASNHTFYCPIVLDCDKLNSGHIYVWDRNHGDDFSCRMQNHNPLSTGGTYYYTNIAIDGGVYTAPRKFTFGGVSYFADGHRSIRCVVPGRDSDTNQRSVIVTYAVNEC